MNGHISVRIRIGIIAGGISLAFWAAQPLAALAATGASPTPQGGRIEGDARPGGQVKPRAMPAPDREAGAEGRLSPGASSQMAVGVSIPLGGSGEKKAPEPDCPPTKVPPGMQLSTTCKLVPLKPAR